MSIDPKDAKPDQVYELTYDGTRSIGQRNDLSYKRPWSLIGPAGMSGDDGASDTEVSDLVPLVPAREITRNDLPSLSSVVDDPWSVDPHLVESILNAIVDHLNERGGIPNPSNLSAEKLNVSGDVQRKSCCEEAALNEERAEKSEADATYWKNTCKTYEGSSERYERRLKKAEAERDDWLERSGVAIAKMADARRERNEARDERDRARQALVVKENDRQELQAKLDAAERLNSERQDTIERLIAEHHEFADAAENRPTLDREAVEAIVVRETGNALMPSEIENIVAYVTQLAPAAEGWPDWMGPKINLVDFEVTRGPNGNYYVDHRWCAHANSTVYGLRKLVAERVESGARYAAIARFIESEQAATSDEEQRIEEQAKALYGYITMSGMEWWELSNPQREVYRAAIRAGVTVPESEASE